MAIISRKRVLIVGAVASALFCTYWVGMGLWRNYQAQVELKRLRDAGVPTTPEDLNRLYAIPPGENDATRAWMAPIMAIDRGAMRRHPYGFDVIDKKGKWPPPPGDDWPDLERTEQYLVDHAELFSQIDAAVATPGVCRYVDDFSGGLIILLPHAQQSRMIIRLLALCAFVNAHRGDDDAALADLTAMLAMTETLSREPILVTQLVRSLETETAALTIERLLPSLSLDDRQLSKLQRQLEQIDLLEGLRISVLGERVLGLMVFDDPASAGAGRAPTAIYRAWINDHPMYFLQSMADNDQAIATEWPGPLRLSQLASTNDPWRDSDVAAPWGGGTWHVPTKFAKNYGAIVERFARGEVCVRAAATAVAALRFRLAHGTLPKSIGELAPEFLDAPLVDPFTGESLLMRAVEGELRVYSVGINAADDGGIEVPTEDENRDDVRFEGEPDVVFSIRNIKERP